VFGTATLRGRLCFDSSPDILSIPSSSLFLSTSCGLLVCSIEAKELIERVELFLVIMTLRKPLRFSIGSGL